MNLEFDIDDVIINEITVYDTCLNILNEDYYFRGILKRDAKRKLIQALERIGEASAKAQGLKDPITTYSKLQTNENQRIYLMKDILHGKSCLVGLLRVGAKKLFVYDAKGNQHELLPLCVLDFYVHTTQQRKGCGKKLFEFMLKHENVSAKQLAIDRPSDKCMKFLDKHFGLKNPLRQMNNFVVFDEFFANRPLLDEKRFYRNYSRIQSTNSNKSLPQQTSNVHLTPMDYYPKIEQSHNTPEEAPLVVPNTLASQQPLSIKKPNSATKLKPLLQEAPKVVLNHHDPFPSLKQQEPVSNFDKELTELKAKIAQNKQIPSAVNNTNKFAPFPSLYKSNNQHVAQNFDMINGFTEKYRKTRLW